MWPSGLAVTLVMLQSACSVGMLNGLLPEKYWCSCMTQDAASSNAHSCCQGTLLLLLPGKFVYAVLKELEHLKNDLISLILLQMLHSFMVKGLLYRGNCDHFEDGTE